MSINKYLLGLWLLLPVALQAEAPFTVSMYSDGHLANSASNLFGGNMGLLAPVLQRLGHQPAQVATNFTLSTSNQLNEIILAESNVVYSLIQFTANQNTIYATDCSNLAFQAALYLSNAVAKCAPASNATIYGYLKTTNLQVGAYGGDQGGPPLYFRWYEDHPILVQGSLGTLHLDRGLRMYTAPGVEAWHIDGDGYGDFQSLSVQGNPVLTNAAVFQPANPYLTNVTLLYPFMLTNGQTGNVLFTNGYVKVIANTNQTDRTELFAGHTNSTTQAVIPTIVATNAFVGINMVPSGSYALEVSGSIRASSTIIAGAIQSSGLARLEPVGGNWIITHQGTGATNAAGLLIPGTLSVTNGVKVQAGMLVTNAPVIVVANTNQVDRTELLVGHTNSTTQAVVPALVVTNTQVGIGKMPQWPLDVNGTGVSSAYWLAGLGLGIGGGVVGEPRFMQSGNNFEIQNAGTGKTNAAGLLIPGGMWATNHSGVASNFTVGGTLVASNVNLAAPQWIDVLVPSGAFGAGAGAPQLIDTGTGTGIMALGFDFNDVVYASTQLPHNLAVTNAAFPNLYVAPHIHWNIATSAPAGATNIVWRLIWCWANPDGSFASLRGTNYTTNLTTQVSMTTHYISGFGNITNNSAKISSIFRYSVSRVSIGNDYPNRVICEDVDLHVPVGNATLLGSRQEYVQ